jgi:nicotinamidase-related amidase
MSDTLNLDPSITAVLFMDFQQGILPRLGEAAGGLLQRAGEVLACARVTGAQVIFVRVGFRAGHPEISERNQSFSAVRQGGLYLDDSPECQIAGALAPLPTEPVVLKRRVSAFGTTDLEAILRARRIETLVLLGIATSGVVLSTVRHAADLDYRLVVASDGCADADAEVHRVLMEKVFPRQASVIPCAAVVAALGPDQPPSIP